MIANNNKLASYFACFAPSNQLRQALHQSQLPPPPDGWYGLRSHPYRDHFIKVAEVEITTLRAKGTFREATPPLGHFVIPTRWVFTYKLDADGFLIKHKARLVVRGDLQPPNGDDDYAATLATRSFRMLMSIMAAMDLESDQFDAVNAFINAPLEELVFIKIKIGNSTIVVVLNRALYGLRRSPKLWKRHLSTTLIKLGLRVSNEEQCLFIGEHFIIFFYVDDMVSLYDRQHA